MPSECSLVGARFENLGSNPVPVFQSVIPIRFRVKVKRIVDSFSPLPHHPSRVEKLDLEGTTLHVLLDYHMTFYDYHNDITVTHE